MFAFDTDGTLTNWTINTDKNGTPQAVDTGVAVEAATYYVFKIFINSSGDADFYINGNLVATVTDAVTATNLLGPWNSVVTRIDTTAAKASIDYVVIESDRI